MTLVYLFLVVISTLGASAEDTEEAHVWWVNDTTSTTGAHKTSDIELNTAGDRKGNILFHLESECTVGSSSDYLQINLYDPTTSQTIIYADLDCDATTILYSEPRKVSGDETFKISVFGKAGLTYKIKVSIKKTDIKMENKVGTVSGTVTKNSMIVKTIVLTDDDIKSTSDWSYLQVYVESTDDFKFKDTTKTGTDDDRLVGKLMVTKKSGNLQNFFVNQKAVFDEALRLSFSTFGMITVSNASLPALQSGVWYIGVVLDGSNGELRDKEVTITVKLRTDYEYVNEIGILFAVSLLGIIIPLLARSIFDVENMKFKNLQFKYWLLTIKNWFWSGKKGMTYLTFLLACLLIVSAFQVVHAKYSDMQTSGDRDTCFYNEKCYRPYGDHYDVSVNGIASNLPFMVQGVILVIYFSISEAYCRSNGHIHFDYSIPYSFGLAFICEGFGSLLYHICPSQIIFQFDTLFMFVISIIMIIAIFEGFSIRDSDLKYTTVASHKAIRVPKVFAFFIGPVYFFNFIGNLIATEGLPIQFITVFYIVFGIWWIGILSWAAYKLDLLPDSLNPTLPNLEGIVEVDTLERGKAPKVVHSIFRYGKIIKTVLFLLYCGVVVGGFVLALLQKLSFSIFILGVLIFGQIVLTMVFFIPTIWTVLQHFVNLPVQLANNTWSVSKHFFVLFGVMMYVLIGCVVVVISLVFFTVFSVTDKSIYPWRSREQNSECYLGSFYDTHDFWHLFASYSLMMMAMVVVQISKPCRECYLQYLKKNKTRIEEVRRKTMNSTAVSAAARFRKAKANKTPQTAENATNGEADTPLQEVSRGSLNPNYENKVATDASPDPHAVEDVTSTENLEKV